MNVKLTGGGLSNSARQAPISGLGRRDASETEAPQNTRSVGEQVSQSIFSRPKPLLAKPGEYPELDALLLVLHKYRRRLAHLIGDQDSDYEFALAQDTVAAIDPRGIIFLGTGFLLAHRNNLAVIVGAIAHEIGHRPKRMRELNSQLGRDMTQDELAALCLHEEIRADSFAGRGLAELGMSCEPLIAFLEANAQMPHPEYLPVAQRAEVIRSGHSGRSYRTDSRRKLFPEYDRAVSIRNHIGEW